MAQLSITQAQSRWRGMLYDEQRYVYRGKFAESRFEKNCLTYMPRCSKRFVLMREVTAFPDHRVHFLLTRGTKRFQDSQHPNDSLGLVPMSSTCACESSNRIRIHLSRLFCYKAKDIGVNIYIFTYLNHKFILGFKIAANQMAE